MPDTSIPVTDYAVIGGGVVGLAVAYGLLKAGKTVSIFDEGDQAFRASRGNFGLIWVQSKGLKQPRYARWTIKSRDAWRHFASELEAETKIDLMLQQAGGYDFHFSVESLQRRVEEYEKLKATLEGNYPYTVLTYEDLLKEEPHIGPNVKGAILHHLDGHVNPLKLLQALTTATRNLGARFRVRTKISAVEMSENKYALFEGCEIVGKAQKIIIAAGLGGAELGPNLGFLAPIKPEAGQILVTERMPPILSRPSATLRQMNEGGIQIGSSSDDVGFDDREDVGTLAIIAKDALAVLPGLAKINLVRSWSALRIMSPDGLPIYQNSATHEGITLVTCHSGVTLAAAHARYLPQWLEQSGPDMEELNSLLSVFTEDRFNV